MSSLRKFSPAIKALIEEASRKCFSHLPPNSTRAGNKVLRSKPMGPVVTNHYHDHKELNKFMKILSPTYLTEAQEKRATKLLRLKRRGKGPPKKGAGKRNNKK